VGLTGVVPVIFYRRVLDSFDLTKATVLWIAGSSLVVFVASIAKRIDWKRAELLAIVALLLSLCIATMFSIRPWSSLFGQYQRYGGLLTFVSLAAIFIVVAHEFDAKWQSRSLSALRAAATVCAAYVILQSLGLDPWTWSTPGQNKPLFGTMGNINTSSGLLGTVSPIFLIGVLAPRRASIRFLSVCGFLLVGGAIGLNESFQGNVAGLVSVAILIGAALVAPRAREVAVYLLLGTTFLLAGLIVNSNREFAALTVVTVILGCLAFTTQPPVARGSSLLLGTKKRRRLTMVGATGVVAVLAFSIGGRVVSEVRGGMVERAAFYQSAFGLWLDRPVFGFGPETFGFLYSVHRPAWHALTYESNRPSSAHSVPIGLLASGGILVFVVFLVFVVVVLRRGVEGIRKADHNDRWVRICTGGAFVAALVQSLVSVEHVALLMVLFVLAGLTVAYSYPGGPPSRSQKRSPTSVRGALVMGVSMVLVPAVLSPQLTRPFRADLAAREGLEQAYQQGDLQSALGSMKRAVEIAPWDPQQLLREVSILQQIGEPNALAPQAIRLAENFNCLPSVAIGAAYAAASIGDFSKAVEISRCAIEHDPKSALVRESVAELFAQMAEASLRVSKVDVATEFLREALLLDPKNSRASQLQISLSSSGG